MISAFYDAALKEAGLTAAQYYLLINLSRIGAANITRWSRQVGLDRSTMVRNVRLLEAHGCIQAAEGHGRVFTLSPEGKRVLAMAVPLWERAQERIETALGDEDAKAVLRINEKLQGLQNAL